MSRSNFPLATCLITLAITAYSGCGGSTSSDTTSTQSALSASTDGGTATVSACFDSYVSCRRADGSDTDTCRKALHDCLRPPGDGDRGGHHDGGACDHDGNGGPPPPPPAGSGSADAPPPPPPPDGSGAPPGPRPEGDGDGDDQVPTADGGPPPGVGPHACIDALDACATSTTDAAQCVSDAVTCFAQFPPPPHRGGRH